MSFIKGYIYKTEELAQEAINQINQALGIPVSLDAVTQTYTNYKIIGDIIFIRWDEIIDGVLGEPLDVEILEEDNPIL